jgi:hypothetical protein
MPSHDSRSLLPTVAPSSNADSTLSSTHSNGYSGWQRKTPRALSVRLDFVSFVVGFPLFMVGVASFLILGLGKLSSSGFSGFTNPYTFLILMLLVISRFEIIVFGLLSNLMIQIRKEITRTVQGVG